MIQTRAGTALPQAAHNDAVGKGRPRQCLMALGLLVTVVALDQATKWWGWRHVPEAIINPGTTWSIGRTVNGWFSGQVTGALLDLLDCALLSLAVVALVRRERPVLMLVSGALMIGGWSSNLLDRLGMHTATAPGSVRGAIDFIRLGPAYWNIADFVILGATAVFLVAVYLSAVREGHGVTPRLHRTPPHRRPTVRRRVRAWATAVGLVVAVARV
jgi:lipoprotein signal peptidase